MKLLIALIFFLLPSLARAHHGQDFFLNLDARVPATGRITTFASASYVKEASGREETSVAPGFLFGAGLGTAIGFTLEWADEGDRSFGYSAFTPMIHWSTALSDERFHLGVAASYRFADGARSGSHHSSTGSTTHHHHTALGVSTASDSATPVPHGLSFNPDAPPTPSGGHDHGDHSHSHGGIHRHGEDFFATRFIFEWQAQQHIRAVANLILVSGGWNDTDLGYSFGVRHDFTHDWAVGLEVIGDLDSGGEHEIMSGLWFTPRHDLNVRLGLGTGIGPRSPEFSAYSGFTWRF